MNREILFRGQTASGEWVEGDLLINTANGYSFPYIRYHVNDINYSRAKVMPETVGQYTGLCDKNGKKIFEGDIVLLDFSDGIPETGDIVWSRTDARFKFNSPDGTEYGIDVTDVFEVIGNIHDNPELLKGGE